jgi:flagellar basal body-associated protein FliL
MSKTLIIIIVVLMMASVVYMLIYAAGKSAKDWKTLDELKQKANTVNTKEEIEEFHKEFIKEAKRISINNHLTHADLAKIDGYLRGKYEKFKT